MSSAASMNPLGGFLVQRASRQALQDEQDDAMGDLRDVTQQPRSGAVAGRFADQAQQMTQQTGGPVQQTLVNALQPDASVDEIRQLGSQINQMGNLTGQTDEQVKQGLMNRFLQRQQANQQAGRQVGGQIAQQTGPVAQATAAEVGSAAQGIGEVGSAIQRRMGQVRQAQAREQIGETQAEAQRDVAQMETEAQRDVAETEADVQQSVLQQRMRQQLSDANREARNDILNQVAEITRRSGGFNNEPNPQDIQRLVNVAQQGNPQQLEQAKQQFDDVYGEPGMADQVLSNFNQIQSFRAQ